MRLHKPSRWIIGSGVYIDSIDEAVVERQQEIEQQVAQLTVKNMSSAAILIAVSFVLANTLARSIKRLTGTTRNISLGNNLNDPIQDTKRKNEISELALG